MAINRCEVGEKYFKTQCQAMYLKMEIKILSKTITYLKYQIFKKSVFFNFIMVFTKRTSHSLH